MPGLTIGWEYLTGYCVATDSANRERAEWPPHPGRVFMALAAAWFETGEDADEGTALRWLENLGDPEMNLPAHDWVFHREVVTVFVPVNGDRAKDTFPDKASGNLQSAPAIARNRQARNFPAVWVGDAPCFLHWPNATATDVDLHRVALDQLCGKVTRIGHSSSMVRMWVAEEVRSPLPVEFWLPDEGFADLQMRRASGGTLNLLDHWFNRRGREQYEQVSDEIAILEAAKKAVKGRGSKDRERKAEIELEIAQVKDNLKSVDKRDPIRPKLGLWSGYRQRKPVPPAGPMHTAFDSDLLILKKEDGPPLPVVSTLAVLRALRGAVMSLCKQPPPAWISGHLETGEPLRDGKQHLAFLTLPHIGHDHSDGHLLGVALAFPDWVQRPERGQALGPMLLDRDGKAKEIKLKLGSLGAWTIIKREWSDTTHGLIPETWTAHPKGCHTWASATPVVLDGFPKEDRLQDRLAWTDEVCAMLARACLRVGLPQPLNVDFDTTSWHQGSPRAMQKRRPLRGHPEVMDSSGGLGDGFPPYPAKRTTGIRPQFHVWLQFAEPVVGPIVLGAGRFLGYGLCKPLSGGPSR